MVSFAADCYHNAFDLGWPIACEAYKIILTEMEAGTLNWANLQAIQALIQQYALMCITKAVASPGASGATPPGGLNRGNSSKFAEKWG